MTVLSIEEFNARCSMTDNSSQKVYQGKTIVGGPVFALTDIDAAQAYCQAFTQQQTAEICLIVKDKNFLRIWIEDCTLEEPKEPLLSYSASEIKQASNPSSPVEAKFVDNCQELLAQYVGPMARIICRKTLAKKPDLTSTELVEILAKKISDPQQAEEFKRQLLE